MPIALVHAFVAMLPRLEAEEQLTRIEAAQLGGGLVEAKEAARRVGELERAALGDARRKALPPSGDALAAIGIGVRRAEA